MNNQTNTLIPEIRFPEFLNDGDWEKDIVDNLISTVTPPKKLTSSNYLESGKYPIIDQSKKFYCGRTNDLDAIISNNLPLIIFGDHTCILKMAKEPFAQGADGIKILKSNVKIIPEFLYQYLKYNEVKLEDYKRHYSILKDKIIFFPKLKTGEQKKIASCLSSLDELIAAHCLKLDTLKKHKKGLIQNLFPQEGEAVPKYRFPEFLNDGDWSEMKLGEICKITSGGTPNRSESEFWSGDIPWVSTTLIDFNTINEVNEYITEVGLKNSSTKIFPKGTILMAMYGQGKTRGKVAILGIEAATNQACAAILLKEEYITNYVFQYLAAHYNDIRELSNKGGQENLSGGLIEIIPISIPNTNEQQKIAECLSSLDDLITAQSGKIDQLKHHKKGLMQGLFPKNNN